MEVCLQLPKIIKIKFIKISTKKNNGQQDGLTSACFFISIWQYLKQMTRPDGATNYNILGLMKLCGYTDKNDMFDTGKLTHLRNINTLVNKLSICYVVQFCVNIHVSVPSMNDYIYDPTTKSHSMLQFGQATAPIKIDIYRTNYVHFELITHMNDVDILKLPRPYNDVTHFLSLDTFLEVPDNLNSAQREEQLQIEQAINNSLNSPFSKKNQENKKNPFDNNTIIELFDIPNDTLKTTSDNRRDEYVKCDIDQAVRESIITYRREKELQPQQLKPLQTDQDDKELQDALRASLKTDLDETAFRDVLIASQKTYQDETLRDALGNVRRNDRHNQFTYNYDLQQSLLATATCDNMNTIYAISYTTNQFASAFVMYQSQYDRILLTDFKTETTITTSNIFCLIGHIIVIRDTLINQLGIDNFILYTICNIKTDILYNKITTILARLPDNTSTHKNKYLKYKTKYINLKNIVK